MRVRDRILSFAGEYFAAALRRLPLSEEMRREGEELALRLRGSFAALPLFLRRALLLILLLAAFRILLPAPDLLDEVSFSRAVYDRRGRLLRLTLSADDTYRIFTPLDEISPRLQEAFLLQEDAHFYLHPGINPVSLVRAFFTTFVFRERRVGGSTLTMQLVRMRYRLRTRTIPGKIVQILRALHVEFYHSKREILEAYLNLIPFGGNVEGVGAASRIYYRHDPRQLSLEEALTLAVVPKSPVRRNPRGGGEAKEELLQAAERLRARWNGAHPSRESVSRLTGLPMEAIRPVLPFLAPHFTDVVLLRSAAREDEGSVSEGGATPGASRIHTSLDLELQSLLERTLRSYVAGRKSAGITNGALLLLDYETMEIRAMVGSADFFDFSIRGQVNGCLARRSPGSTLKPFLYALAFQQGIVHPMTMLRDTFSSFGSYSPSNYDRSFVGPVFVKDALVRSRNVPALRLAAHLHDPDLYDFLRSAGIDLPREKEYYQLSLVLGGAELSMEDVAKLYAMLANRGVLRAVRYSGEGEGEEERRILLSPASAFLTLDILKKNPPPGSEHFGWTGKEGEPVYWKTGTSMGFHDAWAVGIFDGYVLAAWVGDFENRSNPAFVGRSTAGPLFFQTVQGIRALPDHRFRSVPGAEPPEGVSRVEVCALSGDLPGRHCPTVTGTWFIPGVSPIRRCKIHREIMVDLRTGYRACGGSRPTRAGVYEFFPSDLLALFAEAGIPRRVPPPFAPWCSAEVRESAGGISPEIVSPLSRVSYSLRLGERETPDPIPFSAVADADVRRLFWFADESFVGSTPPGETLFWTPRPGRYLIRVVDDHGRSHSRELTVELVQ